MEENRITKTEETGGKPAVWENAPFFLKIIVLFSAFYVFCLYDNIMGITYPLYTVGLLGLYLYFLKKENRELKKSSIFYIAAIFLLGLSSFLTDNEMIVFFNNAAGFLLYAVLFVHNSYSDKKWSFLKYVAALLEFALSVAENVPAVFKTVGRLSAGKKKDGSAEKKESKVLYIVLGLLIALLLLCFILPLLASADPVFGDLIDRVFNLIFIQIAVPENLISILLMFCWGVLFFFALISAVQQRKIREEQKELRCLEPVTAVTALSVIGAVYLLFCLIQISYLFTGGLTLPSDYTYSGFAREGFFQLLFVSILNLALVLLSLELFRNSKALKILLTFISGCTYIMMISSACRMYLYIEAYGLTRLRVLVLAALLAIAVILGGMIRNIYKKEFPLFRFSIAVITIVYVLLSLSHMDALIAKYNIAQRGLDITYENSYLMTLSADAAGVYADTAAENVERTELADEMLQDYFEKIRGYEDLGVRKFNLSRYLGVQAAERYEALTAEE